MACVKFGRQLLASIFRAFIASLLHMACAVGAFCSALPAGLSSCLRVSLYGCFTSTARNRLRVGSSHLINRLPDPCPSTSPPEVAATRFAVFRPLRDSSVLNAADHQHNILSADSLLVNCTRFRVTFRRSSSKDSIELVV